MYSPDNKYVAVLESRIDHLETELDQLNILLQRVGFPEGIITLKQTAEEILQEDQESQILKNLEL
jgi:hypothetical protein